MQSELAKLWHELLLTWPSENKGVLYKHGEILYNKFK